MKTAPSFEELVSRYQQHQEMLNRSAHAWRSHRTYLRQYARFLIEHQIADVLAVTASQVRDFQRWLYYLPARSSNARTPKRSPVTATAPSSKSFTRPASVKSS
jgi:site-specific recombinase XerD